MKRENRNVTELLIFIFATELVGVLSGIFAGDMKQFYESLSQPPLSPPGWIFPVMWSALYAILGITSYCIRVTDASRPRKTCAFVWFGVQLALNFSWSIVFFRFYALRAALVVLLLLIIAVCGMLVAFYKIRPTAAKWNLPYLFWLLFAAYLNIGVILLN